MTDKYIKEEIKHINKRNQEYIAKNNRMTNKQIIIYSENICENYSKEVGCYNTFDGCCIKEQCFTYRLLQSLRSKEQECEKLKEDEKSLLNVIDHLQKQKNEWEEKYNDLGQDFDQLKAENIKFTLDTKKLVAQYSAKLKRLKQTLAEIKEIAENVQSFVDINLEDDVYTEMYKILQKIRECEVKECL